MSAIADALAARRTRPDDFATVLATIFARRYTGSFTVHCVEGVPRVVEVPGEQVRLTAAPPPAPPAAGGLDTPPEPHDPS
jgi:hypothetical protein